MVVFRALVAILAGFALTHAAIGRVLHVSLPSGGADGCDFHNLGDAIAAAHDDDFIYLRPGNYVGGYVVSQRTLQIVGRARDCTSQDIDTGPITADAPATVLDGVFLQHVLQIIGFGDVQLSDLVITHGRGDIGAGVLFSGHGRLRITRTQINTNVADSYGGGLAALADRLGPLDVELLDGTLVSGNSADLDGGGVYTTGGVRLFMTRPQSALAFNTAVLGAGGGLAVRNGQADIASPGFQDPAGPFYGAVYGNNAKSGGGGIAVLGTSSVRLFQSRAATPVRVEQNGALNGSPTTDRGGGIFVDNGAGLCGWGYSVSSNHAVRGAALWAQPGAGVNLFRNETVSTCNADMNSGLDGAAPSAQPRDFVDCGIGDECNRIAANQTVPAPADGAIHVEALGFFNAERVQIRDNEAARTLYSLSDTALQNCVFGGQGRATQIAINLVQVFGKLTMNGCTIAGNALHGGAALAVSGSIVVGDSIIAADGGSGLIGSLASIRASHLITTDPASFMPAPDPQTTIRNLDPRLVDADNGDFHLRPDSPAIGYSDGGQVADAVGVARRSRSGIDVGAYAAGRIFADSFQKTG